ncbi:hypothetical protein BDP81DRAFT_126843 [Colletotrichum phormii]|uniref:Uncharacterized protein n=1 Tax=Colletotrichum phormii TaxID=359342 RepID=A0AAJ0A253_9PEZI|nr:uncharacterized protein BDP81DRAFT_126843 [Colletotrichum phormii]KAK1641069.1 hypothetical protein BDP81DRAFT_126843 [Colletotrichum phormii]
MKVNSVGCFVRPRCPGGLFDRFSKEVPFHDSWPFLYSVLRNHVIIVCQERCGSGPCTASAQEGRSAAVEESCEAPNGTGVRGVSWGWGLHCPCREMRRRAAVEVARSNAFGGVVANASSCLHPFARQEKLPSYCGVSTIDNDDDDNYTYPYICRRRRGRRRPTGSAALAARGFPGRRVELRSGVMEIEPSRETLLTRCIRAWQCH